ncbi:peptidylprolyl isomerase [Uliginosibacterium sp. H3]|uniref:Peptidylprolyl isomerase n=1 Tax=Uliginosibacterium silvisoli TaxID=3114758 RepID=A0ABU6K6Y0_9RHOO|nr:peptidylprolyl isomerase [Uliginosibacterium sp. H3]
MPLSVTTPAVPQTSTALSPTKRFNFPGWMREPLFHFVVLGFLLFAVDQFIVGRADDPRTIIVSADIDNEAKQIFKAARGHEPNPDELESLRRVWLDNEVLYREGLAQQVDKGDSAIRERVIFKQLSVIDANVKLPNVSDKILRDWFEANRVKYDVPVRYDFQEAVLSGDTSEAAVRAFVAALNAGTPGDAKAGLRIFKGRPHSNLVQSYGADFTKALEASPIGEWRVLKASDGWHAMQLVSIAAAQPADYAALRGAVMQDWRDAMAAEQRSAAVRALAKKYKVKYEESRAVKAESAEQ